MGRLVITLSMFSGATAAGAVPQRIVSLSPSVTEILYGIGAFERVVAVSSSCIYPDEVGELPRAGGWSDTNFELVLSLAPDIVIITDAQAPLVDEKLRALGLETLVVGSQSLNDIFGAIESIGEAVGSETRAAQLMSDVQGHLDAIATKVRGRTRPSVLCVVDRLPGTLRDVYVATEGSYLVELVRIAGGDPITPPGPHNYVNISVEAIVSSDPEVVLDVVQAIVEPVNLLGNRALTGDPLDAWRQTPMLRAVKNERVYHFGDTRLVHPSQFSAEAALEMAKRLHPEAFP